MAIIVYDGFDHYKGQFDLQSRIGVLQWNDTETPGTSVIELTAGRGGYGQAVSLVTDEEIQFGGSFGELFTTAYLGMAMLMFPEVVPYIDLKLMYYAPNNVQMTFRFYPASGVVQAFYGDAASPPTITNQTTGVVTTLNNLLATSEANAFSAYTWAYIEIGATIGTSGSYDLHVNGTSVLSGTGVITNSGDSSTVFNGVRIFAPNVQNSSYAEECLRLDDFYLCDNTTGPGTYPCNGFMGDVAVRTLFPTGNHSVQWTPLANQNWQEVSEEQFDGDASYNYATTVGDEDLFTFGSVPATVSTVFATQLTGAYRKQDASIQTLSQSLVSSSTTSTAGTFAMSLSYAYHTDLIVLDPHTGATWTATAVNELIAGYTLAS